MNQLQRTSSRRFAQTNNAEDCDANRDAEELDGNQDTDGLSASFSSNFLLAARIISSLRLCSIFCRASLLLAHPGGGDSSSLSFPFEFTFACKLYRVIRSGGSDFAIVAEVAVVVESDVVVMNEGGGWKDGGAYNRISASYHVPNILLKLTGSSALPIRILSVVACTLPRFRCKSHIISRRLICGNICAIWSTCAGVKRIPGVVPRGAEEDVDIDEESAGEEKK